MHGWIDEKCYRFVIHRPKPFVRVFVSLDDDINTVLVEQFCEVGILQFRHVLHTERERERGRRTFQACADNRTRGRAVIPVNVGAVHGSVAIRYDPRCLIPKYMPLGTQQIERGGG